MPITTIADIRAEGITVAMISDAQVTTAIALWESVFSEACGQWFEPITTSIVFDGDNSSTAFFTVPIIEITELQDLEFSSIIPASDYVAYSGRTSLQDDRRSPKLSMKKGRVFGLGRARYQATGSWGFVEADDSTPQQVRYAILRLIVEKLLSPIVPSLVATPLPDLPGLTGQLVEEETDEHKLSWANPNNSTTRQDVNSGLTKDAFILETIQKYQSPLAIDSPTTWGFGSARSILDEVF